MGCDVGLAGRETRIENFFKVVNSQSGGTLIPTRAKCLIFWPFFEMFWPNGGD